MNPATSVTVVSTIVEDCAGSWPSRVSAIGMTAPARPAMTMDSTMAIQITSARPEFPLQSSTPMPVVAAIASPLMMPTRISLNSTRNQWRVEISRSARPRIVTASAWAPALPDCPATTGNSTASAVNCAIVDSNSPTTAAARNAVARLICSHGKRLRTANCGSRQRALLAAGADHHLDVDRRRFLEGLQQRVVADRADQPAVNVDDGQHVELEVAQLLRDLLAIVERRHGRARRAR